MKLFIIIATLILLAGGGYYAWQNNNEAVLNDPPPPALTGSDITANWKTYASSADYGVRFKYPPNYYLEEKNMASSAPPHYAVILTEDTEENRAVREGRAPGREGPIAITLDVYVVTFATSSENVTKDWIKKFPRESNYKLSLDGALTPTIMGAQEALSYHWSGLYEADSIVSVREGHTYVFTATYFTPEDQIRKDFAEIIKTVKFE